MFDTRNTTDTQKRLSNLTLRVLFALFAIPILLYLLFFAPKWGFFSLLIIACLVSSTELFRMIAPGHFFLASFGVIASTVVFFVFAFSENLGFLTPIIIAIVLSAVAIGVFHSSSIERAVFHSGWLIAGPLYLGSTLASLALLFSREFGGSWVLLAAMTSWFGDTGAYFGGRAFGRHKLCPSVSPNKTVEGSALGLISSLLAGLIAHFWLLPSLGMFESVALATVAGAIGQVGDLSESLMKRVCGVKDSSKIIPGHGGLLDRIDSLLFSSAAIWIYVDWL
jgi:phosphatidate cytidylyltransferase